jgi:hypothetical protein
LLTNALFFIEWLVIFAAAVALYVSTVRAGVGTTARWRWVHWSVSYPLVIALVGRTSFSLMLIDHKSPMPEEFAVLGIFGAAVLAVGFAVRLYVKSSAQGSAPR